MQTRGPLSYQDVISRKKRLSRYSMFVTTIDQDHKNLSFFWPGDPLGRENFAFELHLAPTSITVYGDRIQTVTFQSQKVNIMNNVLMQPKVSYGELAQFLDMPQEEKFALIYRWNIKQFLLDIRPAVMRWVLLNFQNSMWEPTITEILTQISRTVSPNNNEPPFTQLLNMTFTIGDMTVQGSTIFVPEDQPALEISPEWAWICSALRHAAKMYVRHNNTLTKQERRNLRRSKQRQA